jgi:hypothetical protein
VYATPNVPPAGAALVNEGATNVVAEIVTEDGPVPAALFAATEHEYVAPPARPVTVSGLDGPVWLIAPGLHVAV